MRFPAILKELRERNKISQAALARQVGISQSLIAQFETGEKVPNAYVLLRIATYFHTTCEELMEKWRKSKPLQRHFCRKKHSCLP